MATKLVQFKVLATHEGGVYSGPFKDTTVGKVYDGCIEAPNAYDVGADGVHAAGGQLVFIDDVGDTCGAYVNVHEGLSYELVEDAQ